MMAHSIPVSAADDPGAEIVPADVLDSLVATCVGRPRAYQALGQLCDQVGGRTSGAESGRLAEEWAAGFLSRWGYASPFFENVPVTCWTRGTCRVEALQPVGWTLVALAHGNAPTHADVTAQVVDAGHGLTADYQRLGEAVRGHLALVDEGSPPGQRLLHRTEKLLLALQAGAAGLLIYSSAAGSLPRTGVCYWNAEAPIPSLGISQEDGLRLRRLITGGQAPVVRVALENSITSSTARTVLADLPGSEWPEQVVLAGAHLDSWDVAQGAVDNGHGVAIVLEAARALAALGRRPRRTIRFVLWAAEETGLHGSWAYSRGHAADLARHTAVMNFDMTGDPYGFWLPGRSGAPGLLRPLAAQLAGLGMTDALDGQAGLHSDHEPFMLAGVPIVGVLGRLEEQQGRYYHSTGDTFDKVYQAPLSRASAVAAATLWALADAPQALFGHLDPPGVRRMIDEANLYDALVAGGYDGPPMRVPRT